MKNSGMRGNSFNQYCLEKGLGREDWNDLAPNKTTGKTGTIGGEPGIHQGCQIKKHPLTRHQQWQRWQEKHNCRLLMQGRDVGLQGHSQTSNDHVEE